MTGSTANDEHFATNNVDEKHHELGNKQDDAIGDHVGGAPEYVTGSRLAIVMGTIYLSTLLAALDLVRV